jgi:APA family basic amino acid/polyamine antiporter
LNIFQKKTVEHLLKDAYVGGEHHTLSRSLGRFNLTMLGVGTIIGAGIFVLTGQAAAQYAGPAIILSFVISGIACAFSALCYAEMAAMIPVAGSAYTYTYATLGELFAWIIGWDLLLEYLFGAGMVAVGWSGYMVSALSDIGVIFPAALCNAPLRDDPKLGWVLTGAIINLPAVLVVLFLMGLLILGVRESARFNNIIVAVKVTVILLFIGFGISYVTMANLTPFIPPNTGQFGMYGMSGILRAAGVVFVAYIGFDVVSTAAQEARNPQKDMPVGILASLAITTVLYIAVAFVMTGMVDYHSLSVPHPIAVAIDSTGQKLFWLRPVIKIGAIAGISSVLVGLMYGQPRIFYAMSRDGLLPKVFQRVHSRFKTPYVATLITGMAVALLAGLFPIGILGDMISIGTLLAFTIVCLGVLVLRYTNPDIHRPFKVPLSPYIPVMGALIAVVEMTALPTNTWIRLIVWMLVGLIIYAIYGVKNSRLTSGGTEQDSAAPGR